MPRRGYRRKHPGSPSRPISAAPSLQFRVGMSIDAGQPGTAADGHGSAEDRERAAAMRRGEARERARLSGDEVPTREERMQRTRTGGAAHAFAALAENV